MFLQGSESEEDEYHKKKKRSQSKSPSERSSSGESGQYFALMVVYHVLFTFIDLICLKSERSYKKSKKHKKKGKKRRHKSVSIQKTLGAVVSSLCIIRERMWYWYVQ